MLCAAILSAYLLFIDFKCLLDIGDLRGADWQSLDLTGSKGAEVTDCFDVSGTNELPEATRPEESEEVFI